MHNIALLLNKEIRLTLPYPSNPDSNLQLLTSTPARLLDPYPLTPFQQMHIHATRFMMFAVG